MEDINSIILPRVLETLSRKPNLCDTLDSLCHDLQSYLAKENGGVAPRMGNVRSALKKALNVGQGLGVITMTEDTIRVPFNFRTEGNSIRAPVDRVAATSQENYGDDDIMDDEHDRSSSAGRKSLQPRKRNNLAIDSEFFMMLPRRRYPARSISKAPTDSSGRRRSSVRRRRRQRRGVGMKARARRASRSRRVSRRR